MSLSSSKSQPSSQREDRASVRRKKKTWYSGLILGGVAMVLAAAAWLLIQIRPASNGLPAVVLPEQRVVQGEKMPDVAWPNLQGELVRVSDYAGQPVLINTWATWCPPCKKEMPLLNAFYQQYKDQGLVLLAVNSSEEPETVSQFIQAANFTFPVLLDVTGEAINKLGITGFPTSILVGRDGTVQHIYIGEITPETLQEVIIPQLGL